MVCVGKSLVWGFHHLSNVSVITGTGEPPPHDPNRTHARLRSHRSGTAIVVNLCFLVPWPASSPLLRCRDKSTRLTGTYYALTCHGYSSAPSIHVITYFCGRAVRSYAISRKGKDYVQHSVLQRTCSNMVDAFVNSGTFGSSVNEHLCSKITT